MNSEADNIYHKFYSTVDPSTVYKFELQKDLAYAAIEYYIFFNNLKIIDFDSMSAPYIFTSSSLYSSLRFWLDMLSENYVKGIDFDVAPDGAGGLTATYIGDKDFILSLDLKRSGLLVIDVINSNFTFKVSVDASLDDGLKFELLQSFLILIAVADSSIKRKEING